MAIWYVIPNIPSTEESDSYLGAFGVGKSRGSWANVTIAAGDILAGAGGLTSKLTSEINIGATKNNVMLCSFGGNGQKHNLIGTGLEKCVQVDGANNVIVKDLDLSGSYYGIRYWSSTTQSANNGLIQNLNIHDLLYDQNNYTSGVWISANDETYQRLNNVIVDRITVYNCPAHGIALYGYIQNCTIKNSYVYNIAYLKDAHGITCAAGNANTSTSWTDMGSNVFRQATSYTNIYYVLSTVAINGINVLVQNTSTPTTPSSGQWGLSGGFLYVNFGAAIGAATLSVCHAQAQAVYINNNQVKNVTDINGNEGHGIALDDFTSNSFVTSNLIESVQGHGISINRGGYNTIQSNIVLFPAKRALLSTGYGENTIRNNTFIGSGTSGAINAVASAWRSTNSTFDNNIIQTTNAAFGLSISGDITGALARTNNIVGPTSGSVTGLTATGTTTLNPQLNSAFLPQNSSLQTGGTRVAASDFYGYPFENNPSIGAVQYHAARTQSFAPTQDFTKTQSFSPTQRTF